jgi:hypothetical protein
MKQLTKQQSIIFLRGAAMMVIGAGLYVFGFTAFAPWIFVVGAFAFAIIQMQQRYDGPNPVIRRLRRMVLLADVLFMLAGILMVESAFHFVYPAFLKFGINGYNAYLNYVHNNWVVVLLVAAILEMYTTHRLSNELEKEEKKS